MRAGMNVLTDSDFRFFVSLMLAQKAKKKKNCSRIIALWRDKKNEGITIEASIMSRIDAFRFVNICPCNF